MVVYQFKMRLALQSLLTKALISLIAVQIINLGIDAVEFQPLSHSSSIGEFNYLNSMTEYVSEIIMKHTDAFPEFQQKSSKQNQTMKHLDIKMLQPFISVIAIQRSYSRISFIIPGDEYYYFQFSKEINPPPVWS